MRLSRTRLYAITFTSIQRKVNLRLGKRIGFVVGITDKKGNASPNAVLFWKTGVCGGFTTFSTFSLEAYKLFDNKAYVSGGMYVVLSVSCCILGIVLGKKLAAIIG